MDELLGMSDLQLWNVIIGFLVPVVVAVVTRPTMQPIVKIVIQIAFSVVVGFGTAFFSGIFTGRSIATNVLIIFAASVIGYKGFWGPTNFADRIEAKTSPDYEAQHAIPPADDVNPQDVLPV